MAIGNGANGSANGPCELCGYRVNPHTLLKAKAVSRTEFDRHYGRDHSKSWCERYRKWILDQGTCGSWVSYTQYEAENKYSWADRQMVRNNISDAIRRLVVGSRWRGFYA